MWTVTDVLAALGVEGATGKSRRLPVDRACIDSRQTKTHDLFVALQGERADGHDYVAEALAAGASMALVERPIEGVVDVIASEAGAHLPDGEPFALIVPDALEALQRYAAYLRGQRPDLTVIGITGSVGKTTQKEVVAGVLSRRFGVLKSVGNYNNEIGLPQTLTRLDATHEVAVLEMGMYALGEIELLCDVARPRMGLVTNVGPTHLERLGTIERIAEAKSELVQALPDDGVAFLNGDDARVRAMAAMTNAAAIRFGLNSGDNDVWADGVEAAGLQGTGFDVHVRGVEGFGIADQDRSLSTSLLGTHAVRPALGAIAVGLYQGLSWSEIEAGLQAVGQGLRLIARPGLRGATILDDSYNSSPRSCMAALGFLEGLSGRRIAVLGDMLELGDYEREGHEAVGEYAAERVDLLVAVGPRAGAIADGALAAGLPLEACQRASENRVVIEMLRDVLRADDKVLVKGSRGMAMEEIVQALERQDV